ncbi:TPA: L-lactate dehydrogenase [Streptococcus suis]
MKTHKLAVIGVGHVGSHVLANAVKSDLFSDIVVIDPRDNLAFGEALDQAHATGLFSRSNVNIYAGDYQDLKDVDLCIISATHVYPDGPPEDRQVLLGNNAAIVRQIMTDICAVTKEAILLFITNPADTVTYMAATEFDYPKHRVISTGCTLDSARLRYTIAKHYGVDPKSVSAFMYGEHGYTAFPVLSHAQVGGIPFDQLADYFPQVPTLDPQALKDQIVQSAYDVFHAKYGVTNAGVAQAALDVARSIILDEKTIHPVSVYLTHEHDIDSPIAFSVPTILGKDGVIKTLPLKLNEWEQEKLQESIAAIRANIDLAASLK